MNAKHYVSLEVAKMLKEKGYNKECDYCFYYDDYHDKWDFDSPYNLFDDDPMYYNNETIDDEMYSMPTLLEAMDWLEERGVKIGFYHTSYSGWCYTLNNSKICYISETKSTKRYTDRNECMNAAIKKGVELL